VLKVRDVIVGLERFAPQAKAAEWDPVGLQVGDPDRHVRRAGVCHEVTGRVMEEIAEDPVDLLVSYHPLLFEATTRLVAGSGPGGRALRLAELGAALLVAHTNADVAAGGAADAMADALGLVEPTGFGPVWGAGSVKVTAFVPAAAADRVAAAMAAAGGGVIGEYTDCSFRVVGLGTFHAPGHTSPAVGEAGATTRAEEVRLEMVAPAGRRDAVVAALVHAHPYEEPAFDVVERLGDVGFVGRIGSTPPGTTLAAVARRVGGSLGGVIRMAGDPQRPVARLAVIPGSGGSLLRAAADAGADAVVTGDVGHHRARAAVDRGIGVNAAVAALVPEVRDLSAVDADPWRAP